MGVGALSPALGICICTFFGTLSKGSNIGNSIDDCLTEAPGDDQLGKLSWFRNILINYTTGINDVGGSV